VHQNSSIPQKLRKKVLIKLCLKEKECQSNKLSLLKSAQVVLVDFLGPWGRIEVEKKFC
jgi:hypothetical protein